jgi:Lanthionine synthetase C-like protein
VLHRPEAFEPLTSEPWDSARVRSAIGEIVEDVDGALRGPKLLWQAHESYRRRYGSPLAALDVGAAGVLLALDRLRRLGIAETRLDLSSLALACLERFRARSEFGTGPTPEPRESSLLCGETGILLVAWRLAPSADLADALLARVRANVANDADEVMWGTPGTLLAAEAMHEWTGDERWQAVWRETAEVLWSRRREDGLWRQFGGEFAYLGPVHGLVGNVRALAALLDDGRRERLERETAAILERTAVVESGLVNWPPSDQPELASRDGSIRLQWCHGAPGIVATASRYLAEPLLLGAGELIWRAGAHGAEKGASICHGTAGNGYALLELFERTGDERWLARARRFAVHAVGQAERERAERGTRRYELVNGDLGVALFAADCLDGASRYPVFRAW